MNNSKLSIKKFLVKLNLSRLGNTLHYLHQLERWQWMDHRQGSLLQKDRLRDLVKHAYHHVPYYREILENAGVVKNQNKIDLDCFHRIPLLNKVKLRSHFDDLKSDDLFKRKWNKNASGGSTGEPVTFIQDSVYKDWSKAVKILYDDWTGYSFADRKIRLWGSIRDLTAAKESFKIRLVEWLNNDVLLNAFRMTPAEMHDYVRKINDFKPIQILAYAESIYELSRFIENEGLRVYSPCSIITSAGTLFPHMRDSISRVFKAPVFNRYGSREVGDIACECPQRGLHVCAPTHYVEILRGDGSLVNQGEVGEIVVTSLTNFSMPLIRYRIGDMGAWAEDSCPCGRSWPLLKEVKGRMSDIFITKNGTKVYGSGLTVSFFFQDWIKRYQVVQEDYDHIRVLLVIHKRVRNPLEVYALELKTITEKIVLIMGQDCKVEYEFVDDIVPTPSGKYLYTISKLAK